MLEAHDLKPIALKAKEGIGLINGTQFICAFGSEGEALPQVGVGHSCCSLCVSHMYVGMLVYRITAYIRV